MREKTKAIALSAFFTIFLFLFGSQSAFCDTYPPGCGCEEGFVVDPLCTSECPYEDDCCILSTNVVPVSSDMGNILLVFVGLFVFVRYTLKKDDVATSGNLE